MTSEFDAAVIGAGFYGCKVAAHLAKLGQKVALIETESGPMQRASRWNQSRVHHGYHYPRHTLTAMSSAKNYARFIKDYPECIYGEFTHVYAIPNKSSFVSARQFSRLMNRVGLPTRVAGFARRKFFNSSLFEQIFEVDEVAFDAEKLRVHIESEIATPQIQQFFSAKISKITSGGEPPPRWTITLGSAPAPAPAFVDGPGSSFTPSSGDSDFLSKPVSNSDQKISAKKVFNCTYSEINQVLDLADVPRLTLKLELAELALVHLPSELSGLAVTVMDGPFFSMMPFPSLKMDGKILTSVSHVKYTPHKSWSNTLGEDHDILRHPPKSKFPEMSRAISQYIPVFANATYKRSFWELKTILPKNEVNDGRPILFYKHPTEAPLVSLMGGKIDNFYDLEDHVR